MNGFNNFYIVNFAILLFALTIQGQDLIGSLTPQQIKSLGAIAAQDVPKGAPGIATGVVINGKVVYKKYIGYADLTTKTPIGKDSRFNIASNGKQFTAFAVLVLSEEKKLNLDDDIRKFFPDLYPNIKSRISIENLLSHTSGIRDVYDLWSLKGITWWKQTLDNKDVFALLHNQRELNFKPGTRYSYSNSNYILLAEIVGKVTGKSFRAYTNEMFKKLNMPNTKFESDYSNISEPIAKAYFNFSTWRGYNWITNIHGDGNMFSTLDDQLEWEKTLQTNNGETFSRKIIEKSQTLTPNAVNREYGYGLEFGKYRDIEYRFHEGSTGAWKATTVRFPNNISIVTLTNSGKTIPSFQTRQMADIILGLENRKSGFLTKPKAIGNKVSADSILGIYQNDNGFTFHFEKRNKKIYLVRSGRNDIEIVRESDNVFHQSNDPAFKQDFKKNADGEMEVTAYYVTHAPYTLKRLESDWQGFDFKSLEGKYTNSETNVFFEIKYVSEKTFEIIINGRKRKARIISPTKLIADNYSIRIGRAKGGGVKELFLSANRIQRVRFSRDEN